MDKRKVVLGRRMSYERKWRGRQMEVMRRKAGFKAWVREMLDNAH
jgi:hypothetical protein